MIGKSGEIKSPKHFGSGDQEGKKWGGGGYLIEI